MPSLGGVVIAAAGLGSRLGHGVPKCMIDIDGKNILTRLIELVSPYADRIHVVIGYREELIIDYCASYHRDVVLVRNPNFRSTTTIESLRLGARGLAGQLLFVDGDTIIRPSSFSQFVERGNDRSLLLGVTPARTQDAVYVETAGSGSDLRVVKFIREHEQEYEWANVMLAHSESIALGDRYVYEAMESRLPLPACVIELAEVDTERDLTSARQLVSGWT